MFFDRICDLLLGKCLAGSNMVKSILVLFTGDQFINALHRISHIGKTVLMISPIRNRAALDRIQTFSLAYSPGSLSPVLRNIIQSVKTQDDDIPFKLFPVKITALLCLKKHQRTDSSGLRLNTFFHRNQIRIAVYLHGR